MNDIKGYEYIEQVEDSNFVFFIIQITYANGEKRLFQVNVNKEYGIIDSEDKRKKLYEKLKEMGALDYTSVKEELDLQELIAFWQEKQGAKEHRPSNNKKLRFTYLSMESEGESDVYNIQIRYPNEETRIFKVKTKKGSVQISKNDTVGKKELVEFLRKKGLISIDNPNTEINLGTLIKQDGNLYITTLSTSARVDCNTHSNNTGKNYVCSDIHGMYELYMKAKSLLKPEDTLWVLGDATDRGYRGIEIIQDMMKSCGENRNGPQIVYMFGNHDLILLECIAAIKRTGIPDLEIVGYLYNINLEWDYEAARDGRIVNQRIANQIIAEYSSKKEQIRESIRNIEERMGEEKSTIRFHIDENGILPTLHDYFELSIEEQTKIRDFLENSPLMFTTQFGNKKVLLVHSAPPPYIEPGEKRRVSYREIQNNSNLDRYDKQSILQAIVWDRRGKLTSGTTSVENRYKKWKRAGYTTIHGHTPTGSGKVELYPDGAIAIDTSACRKGKLSVYCIEDDIIYGIRDERISKDKIKKVHEYNR